MTSRKLEAYAKVSIRHVWLRPISLDRDHHSDRRAGDADAHRPSNLRDPRAGLAHVHNPVREHAPLHGRCTRARRCIDPDWLRKFQSHAPPPALHPFGGADGHRVDNRRDWHARHRCVRS